MADTMCHHLLWVSTPVARRQIFICHTWPNLFNASFPCQSIFFYLSHLESNYRLWPHSPGLVCANVGRRGILGHLSARCPLGDRHYSTFPVGNVGLAVRTYVTIAELKIYTVIVADQPLTRTDVSDFERLNTCMYTTVPGSPDCRNASNFFHCRTYRLMLSCLHASIIYQSSRGAQRGGCTSYRTLSQVMQTVRSSRTFTFQV